MGLWMTDPPVSPTHGTCGITVSRDAESIGDIPEVWGGVHIPQPKGYPPFHSASSIRGFIVESL